MTSNPSIVPPIGIRLLLPQDATAVYEAVEESRTDVSQWMDWLRPDYCLADARAWIDIAVRGARERSQFDFGIFDGAQRYLGAIGLNQINPQAKCANLGYWVRTSATGRGVAPTGVRLLADWAFAHTDLERLEIIAAEGNLRSQRVAEKAGARREGLLRSKLCVFGRFHDAIMFAIVRSEWPLGRPASTPRDRSYGMSSA